jgi:Xaa-Pro aminopeptidase
MFVKTPLSELTSRMHRFRELMNVHNPDWQIAVIFSKVNLFYFTGTMPEGMLLIPRDSDAVLWVRRSFERAIKESLFPDIKPMESFRDAASKNQDLPGTAFIEEEYVSIAFLKRFSKYFPFTAFLPADPIVAAARSVKSRYELDIMIRSGAAHRTVLEERVPAILKEGMTEVDLGGALYTAMLELGHQGIARFGMMDTEIAIGHIAFGESSLYPTSFNGPGGNYGMSPAVPLLGNRNRKLAKGDLVFIDIGFGIDGYHTDKTMVYIYGAKPDRLLQEEHNTCVEIQDRLASRLKPGSVPSELYEEIISSLPAHFLKNFMGFGARQVKFLGHGIGLFIDEIPVIARGFDEPLQENMVLALEPKKGIEGRGMVGIENTFIVTPNGGRCITGSSKGLMEV